MQKTKRYPGVRPFETEDKDLFFGRESDIKDLSDLIALERLVVLFGKSGYGKSSLINAGIMPYLGQLDDADDTPLLPLTIRLGSFTDGSASPIETILAKLNERDAMQQAKYAPTEVSSFLDTLLPEQPLWYHFKRRQTSDKRRFILIFDQFEEFFTYPLAQQVAFKSQLAELLYQDTPQIVREAAPTLSKDQRRLLANPLEIKVLFAIRADRMSLLDSMKDKLPAILQKRYELKGLTEEQAKEAIKCPAEKDGDFVSPKFSYSDNALRVMTQKLSETKVSQHSGIEAFQLQILCEYLEDKIIKGEIPNNRIEPAYFEDKIDEIYEGYYQRLIDKLDPSVRKAAQLLIEEDLIYHNEKTGDSRRESRDSGRLLDKEGITQKLLNDLESNFLLRREVNSLGGISYEVSHDTLIAPILASKEERRAIEEQEQLEIEKVQKEAERIKLEKEAERERKRNEQLEAALKEAETERAKAEAQTQVANEMRTVAEGNRNRAETFAKRAEEASEKARRNARNAFYFAIMAFIGLVVAGFLYYDSIQKNNIIIAKEEEARKGRDDTQKAFEELDIVMFHQNSYDPALRLLNNGINCPSEDMIKAIDTMKLKYPNNTKLQKDIQSINSLLARCRQN